jgi:hypothetical protein
MPLTDMLPVPLADASLPFMPLLAIASLWYAVPLIVCVSLVCAATRHELMRPILEHALRFGVWVLVFMAVFMGLLAFLERLA